MKNILLFVGAILGTVFLVAGVVAIGRHDRAGWLYLLLALFCFVLAADPGGRLRDLVVRRRPDA
jgi:CDP-diglyceride synthetase